MGYRQQADLELARLISDRLALLLAEQPPRRARGPGPMEVQETAGFPAESVTVNAPQAGEQLAEPLVDELPRQRFGRMHVKVICALLAVGLITAGWLLLRARPVAV